eukprot:213362_1
MYGQMLICKEIAPEKVNGSQFFKNHTIEDARLHKKFENEKIRWNKAASIANLEFQFNEWHQKLIDDQQIINENLKKHGIDYTFDDGLQHEIQ